MTTFKPEMRLFDDDGQRLYLTAEERAAFLKTSENERPDKRMFCHVLHYTGCRPSEALELFPARVDIDGKKITYRTLKKRKTDSKGRLRKPQFRSVPVPDQLITEMNLTFHVRENLKHKKTSRVAFWDFGRSTAWRSVKRVMSAAGISGPQATPKGLRHGFAIAMLEADPPVPLNILADLLGHSTTKTTEIYLQAVGHEKRKMVLNAWS